MADERGVSRVIKHRLGYRHLDPIPDDAELEDFYQSAYIDLVRQGRRFPELTRLLAEDREAEAEQVWLRTTLHADLIDALDRQIGRRSKVLWDVGCGIGEFVASARDAGWAATGLEPSEEATAIARRKGREVVCATLEGYVAAGASARSPAAIVLMNVLEHVTDPLGLLTIVHDALGAGGAVAVRVPNDFNPLQHVAQTQLGLEPWWIAAPDHINYFDHESLRRVLDAAGFDVVDQWGDFPMELFLLMGDDYVSDPSVGPKCHARRRRFELGLDADQRRAFDRSLVPLGWGRNTIAVALAR